MNPRKRRFYIRFDGLQSNTEGLSRERFHSSDNRGHLTPLFPPIAYVPGATRAGDQTWAEGDPNSPGSIPSLGNTLDWFLMSLDSLISVTRRFDLRTRLENVLRPLPIVSIDVTAAKLIPRTHFISYVSRRAMELVTA